MDLKLLEHELRKCSLAELRQVDDLITSLMEQLYNEDGSTPAGTRQKRQEDRFNLNLVGTLTRITDLKPGQRIEFSVAIQDMSRSGMRLHICDSFIPSRIVRIVFSSLNGKIKDRFLEVVRIRRLTGKNGTWLELGCRAIETNRAMQIRRQEDRVRKLQHDLANRPGTLVQVIGLEHDPVCRTVCDLLKNRNYNIQRMDSIRRAFQSARKTMAQLAIICHGSALSQDAVLLKSLTDIPEQLATLAIIRNKSESACLLEAGLDECLLENDIDEFFYYSLERAIIGHITRAQRENWQEFPNVLIITQDRAKAGMLEYTLTRTQCKPYIVGALGDSGNLNFPVDIVVADFDPKDSLPFITIKNRFENIPVIAVCQDAEHGRQAIMAGADNYVNMPAAQRELEIVINTARKTHQTH